MITSRLLPALFLCVTAASAQSFSSAPSGGSGSLFSTGGNLTLSGSTVSAAAVSDVSRYEVCETVAADTLRISFSVVRTSPGEIASLEWSDSVIALLTDKLKAAGVTRVEASFDMNPSVSASRVKSSGGLFGGDSEKEVKEVRSSVNFVAYASLKDRTAAAALIAVRKGVDGSLNNKEGDLKLAYTGVAYELADSESYRTALLAKIAGRAAETRAILAKDTLNAARHQLDFELSGLEARVGQRVSEAGRVTVYIPYSMRWRTLPDSVK